MCKLPLFGKLVYKLYFTPTNPIIFVSIFLAEIFMNIVHGMYLYTACILCLYPTIVEIHVLNLLLSHV